jgi:glycosyltransferase involved in cell wall biosynthesis
MPSKTLAARRAASRTRAIRVAFLVDSPGKRAHGNAAARLALGLAGTGRAESVLLCYSDDPVPSWLPAEVRAERLGVNRVTRALPALVRYLAERQPDVLITRQVHANFVGLAAAAAARARCPGPGWRGRLVLVQDHTVALSHAADRKDNKWLAKLTYRFADGVISPSPAVRDDIVAWCGLDAARTAIVPNAIPKFAGDDREPAPHPWLADGLPPVFVHTSNMMPWKRTDLLLAAFADVTARHEARLLILGEGAGRQRADRQISELGLSGKAQTLGWVADPLPYAARAQAFVLASDEEGFAQVLTEAMSAGCPVVTTDSQGGGPRFVTDNGKYGLLVPMGDRAAIATAMERLLDPSQRSRYAELGLRRAASLSPEACADALLGFLTARFGL